MSLIPKSLGLAMSRQLLSVQKSSPNLLFGAGVVGMVGSTVLACRATLKVEEVLEESQERMELATKTEHPDYSEADRVRDIRIIKVQTVIHLGRLYLPAVAVGALSVAALTKSHNILNERNAALTAAYAAIEKSFSEYRNRVVEKYGYDADQHMRYGSEKGEIVDPDTGRTRKVDHVADEEPSQYARFFDATCQNWSKEAEYNRIFLKCQQNYANDLLHARGHVFLNEVYDMLGLERSKAGSVVGWVLSNKGDNFVDFGVFTGQDAVRDFVNGKEASILLDFNVDGLIYDKIESVGERLSWQKG
jgi:hypothetical protein